MRYTEKPLGIREVQRLRGELLCYRDAKDYLKTLISDPVIRKEAITVLYLETGGVRWVSPEHIQKIATVMLAFHARLQGVTTEQLGADMIRTVQQMTPAEKAELRRHLDAAYGVKLHLTADDREWLQSMGIDAGIAK